MGWVSSRRRYQYCQSLQLLAMGVCTTATPWQCENQLDSSGCCWSCGLLLEVAGIYTCTNRDACAFAGGAHQQRSAFVTYTRPWRSHVLCCVCAMRLMGGSSGVRVLCACVHVAGQMAHQQFGPSWSVCCWLQGSAPSSAAVSTPPLCCQRAAVVWPLLSWYVGWSLEH